jgi:pilus assembly protein CpaF
VVSPIAVDGAILSIRRFARVPFNLERLVANGTITAPAGDLLRSLVQARLNILISGGTGTGKTTLLNAMSHGIGDAERIVTIEDAAELQLQQRHVVRMETRPPNVEGRGEITQRDLVRNALRMRPDRIVLGEVRAGEAFDMLQAMNTGHDGSLTTVHANTPRDALSRIEQMIGMAGIDVSPRSMRAQIASAINVVVQLRRFSDGSRRVVSIQEIEGMEGDIVTMQEIFRFEQTGIETDGRVQGRFAWTGIRPRFFESFKAQRIAVPTALIEIAG